MARRHKIFTNGDLIGALVPYALRLLAATWRFQFEFGEESFESLLGGKPKIFAFWHGVQVPFPVVFNRGAKQVKALPFVVLISRNRDGRIGAKAIAAFGLQSVAGSSSAGGSEALLTLIRKLRSGNHVAITPDGPRGPQHRLKPGVLKLAQSAEVPAYPVGLGCSRAWRLRSWDSMLIPKPFARIVVVVGPPVAVAQALSEEEFGEWCRELEDRLNSQTAKAEALALQADGRGLEASLHSNPGERVRSRPESSETDHTPRGQPESLRH